METMNDYRKDLQPVKIAEHLCIVSWMTINELVNLGSKLRDIMEEHCDDRGPLGSTYLQMLNGKFVVVAVHGSGKNLKKNFACRDI